MLPSPPIETPAGYMVSHVVAYAEPDGTAAMVTTEAPLPVVFGQTATSAVAGTATASGIVGPFVPVVGRAVILALQGSWSGTVQVTRSTDGGLTRLPLTVAGSPWAVYAANCCEAVWDESDLTARLYLEVTLASGSVTYRLAQ